MNMKKTRIWKLTGLFFTGMLLFTLLSRAAYQNATAVVQTAAPTRGTIVHTVQVTGKIVQNQEVAVTTVGGLRIAGVRVNEGQQVAQGDVLLTLDLDYLAEAILRQEQEMQKQKLTVQDAWSQNSATQMRRANSQAQAEENYQYAVSQAETSLERAERDLERAEGALDDFYDGVWADEEQETALLAACQQAQAAYDAAQIHLDQLQQEIENRISEAIAAAEAERSSAGALPEAPDPEEEAEESPEVPVGQALTQQERDAIAQEIRLQYEPQVTAAQGELDQAQAMVVQAEADLEAYRQQQSSQKSEEDLLDDIERAQETYDDALAALENTQTVYGRAIASANLPEASNHSAQIGQITYDQMALTLQKLKALQESGGEILSPVEGVVTKCAVQTGEMTTDTTAMLLADLGQGCRFTGQVTQEQSEYIGVGDSVTLQATSSGKIYKDLTVTTLSVGEERDGDYQITVQLPGGTLPLGASAQMTATRKSQVYTCCVPLSALRLDEKNQTYVLVAEPVNTVLGTQIQAKKVNVTVLERNEHTAALETGTLSSQQQVIVQSDRTVDSGSRIRVD